MGVNILYILFYWDSFFSIVRLCSKIVIWCFLDVMKNSYCSAIHELYHANNNYGNISFMYFCLNLQVNSVRLPRHIANKKHFCGTALVEFSEEEEAKKVFENSLVFAGANLEIRPK